MDPIPNHKGAEHMSEYLVVNVFTILNCTKNTINQGNFEFWSLRSRFRIYVGKIVYSLFLRILWGIFISTWEKYSFSEIEIRTDRTFALESFAISFESLTEMSPCRQQLTERACTLASSPNLRPHCIKFYWQCWSRFKLSVSIYYYLLVCFQLKIEVFS